MGAQYDSKGMLGTYRSAEGKFPDSEGLKRFPGYAAEREDLERGFCRPSLRELPQYDKDNYEQRWTQPMITDLVEDGPGSASDLAFREEERESKGFLSRPKLPIER